MDMVLLLQYPRNMSAGPFHIKMSPSECKPGVVVWCLFSFLFLTISSSISCQAVSSTRRSAWGKFYLFIGLLSMWRNWFIHKKTICCAIYSWKVNPPRGKPTAGSKPRGDAKLGGWLKILLPWMFWLKNVLKIFPINAILTNWQNIPTDKKYGLLNIIVCADQHLEEKSTGSVCSTRGLLGAPGSREGCNPLGLKI